MLTNFAGVSTDRLRPNVGRTRPSSPSSLGWDRCSPPEPKDPLPPHNGEPKCLFRGGRTSRVEDAQGRRCDFAGSLAVPPRLDGGCVGGLPSNRRTQGLARESSLGVRSCLGTFNDEAKRARRAPECVFSRRARTASSACLALARSPETRGSRPQADLDLAEPGSMLGQLAAADLLSVGAPS